MGQLGGFWVSQGSLFYAGASLVFAIVTLFFEKFPKRSLIYFTVGLLGMWLWLPPLIKHAELNNIGGVVNAIPKRPKPGLVEIPLRTAKGKFLCKAKDLPWLNASKLILNDTVSVMVELAPLSVSENPFSFDSQRWMYGESGRCKIIAASQPIKRDMSVISKHRSAFLSQLLSHTSSRTGAGIMAAMTIGDVSNLTSVTDRSFRDTGLFHLLVVSGYQVMFLFVITKMGIFILFPRSLKESGVAAIIGSIIGFLASLYFGLLSGFEAATERAIMGISIACFIGALGIEKKLGSITIATGLVLSLMHPGVFLSPSFELTFAALFGLLIASSSGGSSLKRSCVATLCATSATSLMSFAWFGSITPLAVPMNFIFAPLFSVITTIGTLLGVILSKLHLSDFVLSATEILTLYLVSAVEMIANKKAVLPQSVNYLYGAMSILIVGFYTVKASRDYWQELYLRKIMRRREQE